MVWFNWRYNANITSWCKFGDIVEWKAKVDIVWLVYQIGLCNGKLVLKDIDYNYDDYGSIASFVLLIFLIIIWLMHIHGLGDGCGHAVVHKTLDLDGISHYYNIRIPLWN